MGTATRGWWGDKGSSGTVGAPHINIEVKLVDVAAMGYTSEDKPFPRGEICVRGDGCFTQYYKGQYHHTTRRQRIAELNLTVRATQ